MTTAVAATLALLSNSPDRLWTTDEAWRAISDVTTSRAAVSGALSTLERDGQITRVRRGVYQGHLVRPRGGHPSYSAPSVHAARSKPPAPRRGAMLPRLSACLVEEQFSVTGHSDLAAIAEHATKEYVRRWWKSVDAASRDALFEAQPVDSREVPDPLWGDVRGFFATHFLTLGGAQFPVVRRAFWSQVNALVEAETGPSVLAATRG